MTSTVGGANAWGATAQPESATHPRVADPWRLWLPEGVVSGVHAEADGEGDGLVHAGENWTAPSMSIRDHRHPVWELYLQVHGRSFWQFGGRRAVLGAGSAVAVPPGLSHGHIPSGPSARDHFVYAAVDFERVGERIPELRLAWRDGGLRRTAHGWPLQSLFGSVLRELTERRPLGGAALRAATDLLAIESTRVFVDDRVGPPRVARHPAVARARALLEHHPGRPWTLNALAAEVGLSRGHLTERFTAEVGRAPYAYLTGVRVERCAFRLASTTRTVAEIATESGFASPSAMARTFRAAYGTSPMQWRRRHEPAPTDR